ncbi:MAG: selenium cofactor biosynthesis protein YqeC [Actinomycetia bacterium]|nr:selenium cofactor biosynthesis protein YqeC [Actinomycetes bacterium]
MNELLSDRLGLGSRELVAIVGAGGKTTILHTLASELGSRSASVVLTTTTRMGPDQITNPLTFLSDPSGIEDLVVRGTPLFVLSELATDKAIGVSPQDVDRIFGRSSIDYVIVEADGARTMSIKAPAEHEPVIPPTSTLVVVVLGSDALGKPLGTVAHRVDRISHITGMSQDDPVTPSRAAEILVHPMGGLKGIPDEARIVVAITKVRADNRDDVSELAAILSADLAISRTVEIMAPLDPKQ